MSKKSGDPLSYIRKLEPGIASFIRERNDHGPWEISWVIQETDDVLRKLDTPEIEFRAALFWIRGVGLTPCWFTLTTEFTKPG